jgi:hypothetical protein
MATGRVKRTLDYLGITDDGSHRRTFPETIRRLVLTLGVLLIALVILTSISAPGWTWFLIPFLGGLLLTVTGKPRER